MAEQARKLLLTASLLLLGGPTLLRSQEADRASKIYADSSKSVFLLLVKSDAGQVVAQGTGFVVTDGRIVTNEHVVREGHVYIDLGAARLPVSVEQVDAFNDLAVLTASAELSAKPLALTSGLPAPGAAVYAIGNPAGLERSISTGVVSGIRKFSGRELIQITTPISPGSSGGPIFNGRGEVIGVAVGILQEGQNLNFAVPATLIQKLLLGEVASSGGVTAFLERVERLKGARDQHEYSQEPDSDWQKIGAQINSTLRNALQQAGSDPDLLLNIAKEGVAEDFDIAITAAEGAVRLRPSADANLILARALGGKAYSAGDSEKAAMLERAEKAARTALRLSKTPTPEIYYQLADVLEDRALYAEAEKNFNRALDLSQATGDTEIQADSLRGLVRTTYSSGKNDQTDTWFRALVNTGKATAWDWQGQARRLDKEQRFSEAGSTWQQAAVLSPALWTSWCEAAGSFVLAGSKGDSVLFCARKCISDGSGKPNSEARLADAHREVADVLNERGVYEEALSHANESTVLNPEGAWAYDAKAVSLIGLRRFQEAINAAKQAIRLSDGKYGTMHFHLGDAYFETENWQFAKQSYEKAAELMPGEDASAYNVALCYQRLGLFIDAANWYAEVLRRNPTRSDRQELLDRISALRR